MKIKTVCELTDLSDRAIRHYIQEGLIAPAYSENYLGRRAFDFTQADVRMLKDIVVLRKFGFSIPEIKQVQENPWDSWTIVNELCERKRAMIESEQALLAALSGLEEGKAYTVAELAKVLSAPVKKVALPAEDERSNRKFKIYLIWSDWKLRLWGLIKIIGVGSITCLPFLANIWRLITEPQFYLYPVLNSLALILTIATLLPSVTVLILIVIDREKIYLKTRYLLLIICVVCIPMHQFFSFFIVDKSETTVPFNYRRVDPYCSVSNDQFYHTMFPKEIDSSLMFEPNWECHYYYSYQNNFFGEVYDIYAEWQVTQDSLDREVLRISQLWETDQIDNENNIYSEDYQYITIQKGSYTCFIKYYEFDQEELNTKDPLAGDGYRNNYVYYIFAFDNETNTVRYITCFSMDVAQPYFLELDW